MALVGTISGSNNTSNTAITGTLVIANTISPFPSIQSDAVLFVSGNIGGNSKAVFGGDIQISGSSVIDGDVAVNGGDITTTASTANIFANAATITLGNVGGSSTTRIAYGQTVSPAVKTIEIGTRGNSGSTTNISIGVNVAGVLGRTTLNQDVALTTGNLIGAPGSGANVMTLISSGNIIARLDTDNSAPGHKFAVQDYLNADKFSITEAGAAEISDTLFATGSITTSGSLKSVMSVGSEGGEIFLSSPASSTSINTGVNIDVYQNKVRIFESGGSTRGGYYDITSLGDTVATDLLRGDPLSQFLYRRSIIAQAAANNSNDIATFGTSTAFVQNGGGWSLGNTDAAIKYTTSTTVDTAARWRTPGIFLRIGHTGRFRFRVVTGASIASETIIMGIQSDDAFTYNPAGRNAVTVVYDAATSANWLLFTKDGTTASTVDTGVAVATTTPYSFDVKFTASSATLSVNGGTPVSTTSNMPGAGADLYFLCGIGNRSGGAARDFSFVRAVLECGS